MIWDLLQVVFGFGVGYVVCATKESVAEVKRMVRERLGG